MTFIVEYPQTLTSMKTTQTKRGRPVGSKNKMTTKITVGGKVKIKPGDGSEFPEIDKFKSNTFAKKWKEELEGSMAEDSGFYDEILESADQVKSWNRSPISQTVNLTYLFLAFIIGFSVCAIVLTPLVINSI